MARAERQNWIKEIEGLRQSRLITYVTTDRPPVPGQIGDDAVRPMYELLRGVGNVERLDLFLYTLGGATDVPYRIVTALRRYAKEWNVLVPFRANSAGTLITLGADQIIMGTRGELGPIDPTLQIKRMVQLPGGGSGSVQDNISVEDVMAFVKFIQERCKISEQPAFTSTLERLIERVDPVALGSVYRTHSHIRDVARRILRTRTKPPSAKISNKIVKTLAEKVYAHGHAVGLAAAQEIGLPAVPAEPQLEDLMWKLLHDYESTMKMGEPLDPAHVIGAQDRVTEESCIAMIETTASLRTFQGYFDVRAKRQLPTNLQVSMNLSLQLPQGFNPAAMPPDVQQLLQEMIKMAQEAALKNAQPALTDALKAQAPLAGVDVGFRNGRWVAED